ALRRRVRLAPDADTALRELPVDSAACLRLVQLLHHVEEHVPTLYTTLPQQIIHGDFDPSNVLMEGDRILGLLDFEFSGQDLRVADLLIPLTWWPLRLLGSERMGSAGRTWPRIYEPAATDTRGARRVASALPASRDWGAAASH